MFPFFILCHSLEVLDVPFSLHTRLLLLSRTAHQHRWKQQQQKKTLYGNYVFIFLYEWIQYDDWMATTSKVSWMDNCECSSLEFNGKLTSLVIYSAKLEFIEIGTERMQNSANSILKIGRKIAMIRKQSMRIVRLASIAIRCNGGCSPIADIMRIAVCFPFRARVIHLVCVNLLVFGR